MSVEISNLHIEYPGTLVFHDVNLSVADDEIVVVHTEVLDGGTSLLKGIAGLLRGVSGKVMFNGFDLLGEVPEVVQHKVGFVYETHGLVSLYSVYQNIGLPLQFHTPLDQEQIHKRVLEVCDLLNIPEEQFELRPHSLNDVQTRMVNLARALVVRPNLLLIDEIEGGMSDDYLHDTMKSLKERQSEFPMAVIITSSSELVANYADRNYIIQNNNLVAA